MADSYVTGMGGLRAARTASHRIIFRDGVFDSFLSQGKIIDGAKSRDSGNTGDLDVLRAGLLMGKITTGGKYAPSIIGVSTAAIIATATTINVSAAQAVEIVRRIGATGTLRFTGPPTAAGVVATFTETYSAVNQGTGDITISAADAALIAGSFVSADDGSQNPVAPIADGWGVKATDVDGANLDVPFERLPISGVIVSANILPVWPSDTSLRTWIREKLSTLAGGKWIFDDQF